MVCSIRSARTLAGVFIAAMCFARPAGADSPDFRKDVQPLLKQFCYACHGDKKQEGNLRLDTLNPDLVKGRDGESWHDALNKLNRGEMPPKKAQQLLEAQRNLLVKWITAEISRAESVARSTGGRVVMRRLTRYEYNNTMRDLLGIELNFAEQLPPEPSSKDGFKNNGSSLGVSPIQIEQYLKVARNALGKAIVTGSKPKVITAQAEKSAKVRRVRGQVGNELGAGSRFLMRMKEFPREGSVLVQIRARAIVPSGKAFPRMRVAMGVRADVRAPEKTLGEIDLRDAGVRTYEFRGRIEEFPLPGHNPKYPGLQVTVYNDSGDVPTGKKKRRKKNAPPDPNEPRIVIEQVRFVGPVFETWPPRSHTRIFFAESKRTDEREYAGEILSRFMRRAYRRPVGKNDVAPMLSLFDKIRPRAASFESAMRDVLAMVLVSPEFLYLVEPRSKTEGRQKLTAHELASRLSYFLWSTMPDETLSKLADSRAILQPKVLSQQVARMLADPRSREFVKHFVDQWLDLPGVDRIAVNPEFHPSFDDRLKKDMRLETQKFFAQILDNNLSALNLIDSDFAMLNYRLAKHYGIDGPTSGEFQKVKLPADSKRGGVLTQGSFLLRNSNGEDSHPIKRAVWILERLLDDPPAPPPPDVPDLNANAKNVAKLSLKQRLEAHRRKPSCNSCHRGIDPWGVALENFDAIGKWRTVVAGPKKKRKQKTPVDALAILPDDTEIKGIDGLKTYLLKHRQQQFSRALAKRVMTYGLGRSLELADRKTIDAITRDFIAGRHNLKQLISAVVASESFRTK